MEIEIVWLSYQTSSVFSPSLFRAIEVFFFCFSSGLAQIQWSFCSPNPFRVMKLLFSQSFQGYRAFVPLVLLRLWSFGSLSHYRAMKLYVFSCFLFLRAGRLTQDISQGSNISVCFAGESLVELSSSTSTFEARSMFFLRFLQDTRSFSFEVGLY